MMWIEYDYVCNENLGITLHKKVEYNEKNLAIAQQEAVDGNYTLTEDDEVAGIQPMPIGLGGTNAKTAEEACKNIGGLNTYIHGSDGLIGMGANGKFKATKTGTWGSIKVNGAWHSIKCGEDTLVDLVAGCWYTFIIDGTVVNFNSGGAGGGLNFKVVGGTSAPASPKENTIWGVTDVNITSWYFCSDEPNVYDIQPLLYNSEIDQWHLVAPHPLREGDIINFTIPATVGAIYEAIRIYDSSTGKDYCVRQTIGSAVNAWSAGTKVSVRISNEVIRIGDWSGNGTAYLVAWGKYYHEEGTVWFITGASSHTAFNALKKNSAMIYPVSAKVYSGGTWWSMEAYLRQGGKWVLFNIIPEFTYTGNFEIVNDSDEFIESSQDNWKIRFLTSGTLTFNKLIGATNGIDVFLVGGGGGGKAWDATYSGPGGGGGYTTTKKAVTVKAGTPYEIVIGAGGSGNTTKGYQYAATSGGKTTAFGFEAGGGEGRAAGSDASTVGGKGGSGGAALTNTFPIYGGTDGASGANSGGYKGGAGQGTTTREFADVNGRLYASGGSCLSHADGANGANNTGNGGDGGGSGFGGRGGSGIVVIRNKR